MNLDASLVWHEEGLKMDTFLQDTPPGQVPSVITVGGQEIVVGRGRWVKRCEENGGNCVTVSEPITLADGTVIYGVGDTKTRQAIGLTRAGYLGLLRFVAETPLPSGID